MSQRGIRVSTIIFSLAVFWSFFGMLILSQAADEDKNHAGAQSKTEMNSTDSSKKKEKISHASSVPASACLVDSAALSDVQSLREQNEKKEKELKEKEADLERREAALSGQFEALRKAREELKVQVGQKSQENQARIGKLVETILKMSPKKASELLSEVEEGLAVEVIYQLDTDRLGKILNVMDTKKSSTLSEMMVGMMKKKGGIAREHQASASDQSAQVSN